MKSCDPTRAKRAARVLCTTLCLIGVASIAPAQTEAALEPNFRAEASVERAVPAPQFDGIGSADVPMTGEPQPAESGGFSKFAKSLGDPQAWACNGQDYDLATSSYSSTTGGEGQGRAIGFQADSYFKLNAVSIWGDLTQLSFDVVIYSSTDGHTAGSVLATFSATVGGTGEGWNTVPVAFDFVEGDFYVVNWRPTSGGDWATTIEYYEDTALPETIGPLTIVEGYSGADAETPGNSLHPRFKFLVNADCHCQDNDLQTPVYNSWSSGSGAGTGRAIGFHADRSFTLNAVSIWADLKEMSFDVVIYESSDGHTADSELATFSAIAGGTGADWNVVPVSYRFMKGRHYVVNWRPSNLATGWANFIEYYRDGGLPFTTGPVTIVEGIEGADADNTVNSLHPHLSFCISGDGTVAVLGAPGDPLWDYDVKEKLLDTGLVGQVDVINVEESTPTLTTLLPYGALLVYSDTPFFDAVALGDVLADYIDSGGGVVTSLFANNAGIGFKIAGRFETDNYWAMIGNGNWSGAANLGAVWSPTHAILDGVSTFFGGTSSYRPNMFSFAPGADNVADWTDGRPLVTTKVFGPAKRVDLGFYPPSSDARGDFWDATTDGALLMANALAWVKAPGCTDCDLENFSDPLVQWQNRWLFLNSNIENWYVAAGNCDPGTRGNQPDGIWISDDPGCGNETDVSPVRIDFINGYGDEASSFSLDHFTCVPDVIFNVYDKDGVLVATEPIPANCWNWSSFSTSLPNGISAFEYVRAADNIQGNTAVDNVKLCFPLFRDDFESNDTSEWSSATSP